jgi:endonuclease-3
MAEVATELTRDASPAERLPEIIRRLRAAHPDARCALDHRTPLQLLVATILSAQSTDEQVNKITPALFEKYPTAADFAAADRSELEEAVHATGFYRRKAGYLQATCETLAREHGGEVPADMNALLELPGVARKTANVVLGVAFGIAAGVVVDTHVKRLAQRLALTEETNPDKIERDLMQLVPREDWIDIAHLLIFHGRRVCSARRPDCAACSLNDLCPSADV